MPRMHRIRVVLVLALLSSACGGATAAPAAVEPRSATSSGDAPGSATSSSALDSEATAASVDAPNGAAAPAADAAPAVALLDDAYAPHLAGCLVVELGSCVEGVPYEQTVCAPGGIGQPRPSGCPSGDDFLGICTSPAGRRDFMYAGYGTCFTAMARESCEATEPGATFTAPPTPVDACGRTGGSAELCQAVATCCTESSERLDGLCQDLHLGTGAGCVAAAREIAASRASTPACRTAARLVRR